MRNISDIIEQYLKESLQQSPESMIEIQRNDLAYQFQCVPSQINYVISTRFTLEKGYLVESKRGGGGYIRIRRIQLPAGGALGQHVFKMIGDSLDQQSAEGLIDQLEHAGFVNAREASIMRAAVCRDVLSLKLPIRDEVRARLMKAMLVALI